VDSSPIVDRRSTGTLGCAALHRPINHQGIGAYRRQDHARIEGTRSPAAPWYKTPVTVQYHLKLSPGDVAPYVLLPGDPGRVPLVASMWDESHEVASNREYVTFTGTYRGVPISCTSTGIGCPSTAIAMEELARVGATTFVRIGTCGTFQDRVHTGDIAIFDSAARYDGASRLYAPIEFPAVADHEVVSAAIAAGRELGLSFHVGTTRTADSFYALHPQPGSSFGGYWQSSWREHFEDLKRMNVVAAEMEASVIFVLARIWGLRAGGVAIVLDNVLKVSGDSGDFDPQQQFDHGGDEIERLARMGSEIVRILAERDAAA